LSAMMVAIMLFAARGPLVIPLTLAGILVALLIPFAASRGKLHVPGYVGLVIASFGIAFIFGRISGVHGVRGSTLGVVLSILFFLLIAVAAGSMLAILFYRAPPET
jgi:hypothetical protein